MTAAAKERSILFSAEMVRAILGGRKTQTRRVVKPPPLLNESPTGPMWGHRDLCGEFAEHVFGACAEKLIPCPYGVPGERLYVKEAHEFVLSGTQGVLRVLYKADMAERDMFDAPYQPKLYRGRPSIHLPRWASRITLEITEVRVQCVAEISEEDAIAEGCVAYHSGTWWQGYRDCGDLGLLHDQCKGDAPPEWMVDPKKMNPTPHLDYSVKHAFSMLWDNINGRHASWASNPWCWAISFKRLAP